MGLPLIRTPSRFQKYHNVHYTLWSISVQAAYVWDNLSSGSVPAMESQMVQNPRHKYGLTFNKIAIKVRRDFNQTQQNQFTFNWFSVKVKIFKSKLNKIMSSLSTNFLSRARDVWVTLKRLLTLHSKKHFSHFQASFHLDPKFPVTFQQLDLSRSRREWHHAQRSQIAASTTRYVVNPNMLSTT